MDAYVKCGRVKDARQVFDELPNKHIVTWNSMISSYTSLKRSKEAIGLYERMILEEFYPMSTRSPVSSRLFLIWVLYLKAGELIGCQWFWVWRF